MDDLLITPPDSAAALLEGPDVGSTNGSKSASPAAMIVFEDVRKVYEPDGPTTKTNSPLSRTNDARS